MSEHTPGPWRTDGDLSTSLDVVSGEARIAMIDELSDLTDEQLVANALLIAAAPDLLEAGKLLMQNLDGMAGEVTSGYHEEIIAPLRNAIAKATGENQ